jgi:hypothetical protein
MEANCNEEAGEYFGYTVLVCGPLLLSHTPEETTKIEDGILISILRTHAGGHFLSLLRM